MKFKIKIACVLCLSTAIFSACSSSAPTTNNIAVEPKALTVSVKQMDTAFTVNVADWLKSGVSDSFSSSITLNYDASGAGAYTGSMTFKPAVAQGKAFDSVFYDQFVACLANDLAAAHHAKSWLYYGLHAEDNADPNKERDFFIILRNDQTIESIQKRYMLPLIDETGFYKVGDPLFSGSYCAHYKSNLSN